MPYLTADVENFGRDRSIGELEEIVLADTDNSVSALKAIAGRDANRTAQLAERIISGQEFGRRLRLLAATHLGDLAPAGSGEVLYRALKEETSPPIRRQILRSIGRVAEADMLERVTELDTREAEFAGRLIAYRHGLTGRTLPSPSRKDLRPKGETRPVKVEKIEAKSRVELRDQPIAKLECFDLEFLIATSPEIDGREFIAQLQKGPAIPARIYSIDHRFSGASLTYYVMTHPVGDDSIAINLVTRDGNIRYTGNLEPAGTKLTFSIGTAKESILPPTRIQGEYHPESSTIEFEEGISQIQLDPEKIKTPRKGTYRPDSKNDRE